MRLTKDQLYKPYGTSSAATSTTVAVAADAEDVAIADAGSLIDATDVEGALQEIAGDVAAIPSVSNHANADGAGGTNEPATNKVHNAAAIELADSGSLYTAADVEAAIAEAMTVHNSHKNADGSGGASVPASNKSHNAAAVGLIDAGSKFTATDVEAAALELYTTQLNHKNADGAGGSSAPATNMAHNAAAVGISDAGSLFTAETVEAALQEEAAKRILGKHYFSYAADEFPMQQCWYRNHSCDNTKSTSDSTPITITSVSTTNGTFNGANYDGYIILSWVPYRTSIFSPVVGEEWAAIDLEYMDGGSDPSRTGDYILRLKIIGGVYADKKLYYAVDYGSEENLAQTHKILLYNPHYSACGWDWLNSGNSLLGPYGSGWRSQYIFPSGVFKHSDGTYRMVVTGVDGSNINSIGGASSSDLINWTILNSDSPYFAPSGASDWRHASLFGGSGLYYLDHEQKYYQICCGKNASGRYTLGWIKFDENFENAEYAVDEPVSRTASYDHWFPSVCKYGSRWILTYTVDNSPSDVDNWIWKQAYANRPEGPYGDVADVFGSTELTAMDANDGIFCSSHFTDIMPFIWRGRMYALAFGASHYKYSGNRANALMGLLYWNEREGTPHWEIDPRSPIFFNAIYASNTLWGSNFMWQNDHLGGRICLYQENQFTYFFFSANSGTDTYRVLGRRLQLS